MFLLKAPLQFIQLSDFLFGECRRVWDVSESAVSSPRVRRV